MVEITFANPNFLWMLLAVPILVIIYMLTVKKSKDVALKFSNFEALERISKSGFFAKPYRAFFSNKNIFQLLMRLLIYTLLILAVAGLTLNYVAKASKFNFVLAIDASSSMLADDIPPTRFEAVKSAANYFIDNAPNNDIGIVSFAGTVFVDEKITDDKERLKSALFVMDIKESGGTNIGDAIITAGNIFSDNQSNAIILFTDGQSNVGTAVDDAIQYAQERNIVVHAIGIGTENGGQFVPGAVSKIDDSSLRQIANFTRGMYFRAENNEQLKNAYSEILNITDVRKSRNISFLILLVALALLSLELFLANTIYKTVP